jgi:hypothetical protein
MIRGGLEPPAPGPLPTEPWRLLSGQPAAQTDQRHEWRGAGARRWPQMAQAAELVNQTACAA